MSATGFGTAAQQRAYISRCLADGARAQALAEHLDLDVAEVRRIARAKDCSVPKCGEPGRLYPSGWRCDEHRPVANAMPDGQNRRPPVANATVADPAERLYYGLFDGTHPLCEGWHVEPWTGKPSRCGRPMVPALLAAGITVHPCCEPPETAPESIRREMRA